MACAELVVKPCNESAGLGALDLVRILDFEGFEALTERPIHPPLCRLALHPLCLLSSLGATHSVWHSFAREVRNRTPDGNWTSRLEKVTRGSRGGVREWERRGSKLEM